MSDFKVRFGIVCLVLWSLAAARVPSIVEQAKRTNESAAVSSLEQFWVQRDEFADSHVVSREGYHFQLRREAADELLVAWPIVPGRTGDHVFVVDRQGEVSREPCSAGRLPRVAVVDD